MSVEEMLSAARSRLRRLTPHQADEAVRAGAVIVDIRPDAQRTADGAVPAALIVPRNVLEWRCDPACGAREEAVSDPRRQIIVMCDEGYQSSLAAATLLELGLPLATDVVGGFQAWRRAGLAVR